jgi:hypothetical protein
MRRRRDDEDLGHDLTLRPATPRHASVDQLTALAVPATPIILNDPDADARSAVLSSTLGRIQLNLDLLLRKIERVEERLMGIERALAITAPTPAPPLKVRRRGPSGDSYQAPDDQLDDV